MLRTLQKECMKYETTESSYNFSCGCKPASSAIKVSECRCTCIAAKCKEKHREVNVRKDSYYCEPCNCC